MQWVAISSVRLIGDDPGQANPMSRVHKQSVAQPSQQERDPITCQSWVSSAHEYN